MNPLSLLKWNPKLLVAGGATALAMSFGAGWQVATWRADAGFAEERLRIAAEAASEAREMADALERRDKERNAAAARLTALRGEYTEILETINEMDSDGVCDIPADVLRTINGLR